VFALITLRQSSKGSSVCNIMKETKSEETVVFTTGLIYYTCELVAMSHKELERVKIVQ
jgi:hypothetical protein